MAGENNLELEIKGDKDKVKEMIESLEDVFEYEFAESEAENIVRLKIKSDRDVDLREKIFYIWLFTYCRKHSAEDVRAIFFLWATPTDNFSSPLIGTAAREG